jgi:hypothetical protein
MMDGASDILNKAIKAVPAVKYALGIAGIVAGIAIVASMHTSYTLAAFGTVIMLILMTVLVVFARVTKTINIGMQTPALVFTWFALLLTMATAFLLFTSVFFGIPVDLKRVFVPLEPSASKGVAPAAVAAQNAHPALARKVVQTDTKDSSTTTDDAGAFGLRVQNVPPPDDLSDEQLVTISMSHFIPVRLNDYEPSLTSQTPIGLKVVNVIASSSASRAGIKSNDLITKIGPDPIWNTKQWVAFTNYLRQDDEFDIQVWRNSAPVDFNIRLGNRLDLYRAGCGAKQEDACYGLGLLYEEGDALPKDIPRAKYYLNLACTLKSGSACTELGILTNTPSLVDKGCSLGDGGGCREQSNGLKSSNPDLAARALKSSCDFGDSFACADLTTFLNLDAKSAQAKQLSRRACWWGEETACNFVDPVTYAAMVEKTRRHNEKHKTKRSPALMTTRNPVPTSRF